MTNTMSYKGYSARIEYDDDDGIFTGRVAGIRDGVGFHADTVEGLREAFHEAAEDYIETCARIGKEPQKAFSGQVMFRISPEVHRKAALAAELSGKSLNQWAEEVLDRAASQGQRVQPTLLFAPPACLSAKSPATASASHGADRPRSHRIPKP